MACQPHILMFPIPTLGDMGSMLKLAELLCLANLKVTFINTVHNHKRQTKHADIEARFSQYSGFQFKVIPDGLPDDHPRAGGNWFPELFERLQSNTEPFLRDVMSGSGHTYDQVTCLIADASLGFAFEVAAEAKVPVIEFRALGACYVWIFLCLPKLMEAGEIPFKDEDMDELIQNVPGMDGFLRRRDLPSFFRNNDELRVDLHQLAKRIQSSKAHPLILNTFEHLEGPTLTHLRAHFPKIYTIGPLHSHLKHRRTLSDRSISNSSSSLWEEDRSCISWLDQKPDKSVIYVSFGSLTTLKRYQLMEIWAGLVCSKKYFLWVVRPGMITDNDPDSHVKDEILEGTKERGLIVGWTPQEEILAHRAVGGFLTHSGWNSTLESITAGVPMLCWPYFADQQVNSRFVSHVWRIGLDMKDTCDRSIVEKMVRELMDDNRDELQQSVAKISDIANKNIIQGGDSSCNFDRLIEDIHQMPKLTDKK